LNESGLYLTSFQKKLLRKQLQSDIRPEYLRRIQIMLLADEGKSQAEICQTLLCSQETARHWISMARLGQAHLWSDSPMGRPKVVDEQYLERLKELVTHSPRDYGYSFHRWTCQWLSKHLANEFGIKITDAHISRLLKKMRLSTRQQPESQVRVAETSKDSAIAIADLSETVQPTDIWAIHFIQARF
jgi:putative transposase